MFYLLGYEGLLFSFSVVVSQCLQFFSANMTTQTHLSLIILAKVCEKDLDVEEMLLSQIDSVVSAYN